MDDVSKHISDAETLKAVSHPLRARMLGALRILGPATASQLARRFEESSGSTSYHLRVLAKYNFIEEDPQQPNARDRRWQATSRFTAWNDAELRGDPDGVEASRAMRREQVNHLVKAVERYESDIDSWGPVWQREAGLSDMVVGLRANTLGELSERITALIDEYAERDKNVPGAELVQVYLGAFPLDESQIQ